MTTLTGHQTIEKKSIDGKMFSLTIVKCVEDKKWYILEDECGVGRTKQGTIKAASLTLDNMIEDYEYDNGIRL